MKVVIWTGPAWEDWGPRSVEEGGIGGSETAAVYMARELRKLGNEVVMYGQHSSSVTLEGDGGVTYRHYDEVLRGAERIECDVFVSSRDIRALRLRPEAKIKVLWVHDIHCGDDWENDIGKFDKVFCLSSWARKTFIGFYPFLDPKKVELTTNGIDARRFERLVAKDSCRITYSSSPDRGLDVLLSMWDMIKGIESKAELHVYYGFDNWLKMAKTPLLRAKAELLRELVTNRQDKGIYYHGRVGQKEIAESFMKSRVWLYPTGFKETYCITAQEAQAAMALPITTDLAALSETVGNRGILIPPHNTTSSYRNAFLEAFVRACNGEHVDFRGGQWITSKGEHVDMLNRGRQWAMARTWASVAEDWHQRFKVCL